MVPKDVAMVHKIRKVFSKFYQRHLELIAYQGISVYKFKIIFGKPYFSDQFITIIKRYKR